MSLTFQNKYYSDKINYIVGVDEAGRGPLAGPVVAAAVVFPRDYKNKDIDDSKKLTEKKREKLFEVIKKNAIGIGIGICDADEIDRINIYEATKKAMIEAIKQINKVDLILTDAMKLSGFDVEVVDIVKGDAKALPIAAASIIAKVTRDHMMDELDNRYPNYGFKKHKGYGTKSHLDALKKYGIIEHVHRISYRPVRESKNGQIYLFDDF